MADWQATNEHMKLSEGVEAERIGRSGKGFLKKWSGRVSVFLQRCSEALCAVLSSGMGHMGS